MRKVVFIIIFLFTFNTDFRGREIVNKLPIVFSPHYDITLGGVEKLHPFDTGKYGKVYEYLVKKTGIAKDRFYVPDMASQEDLLSVHSKEYLDSLKESLVIAAIAEVSLLRYLPNSVLQNRLLKPMKYATGGTILGCELALKYGWAINLSGGYHHAKRDSGGGFCFYADIPIAIYKLFTKKSDLSVMIVDLDAHQGNGCESIFADDCRVYIFDVYNKDIYPWDDEARRYIDFNYPVESYIGDKEYLSLIEAKLTDAILASKPDIIVYNAGTDIFREDPLGCMNISHDGIIKRDEIVFKTAIKNDIPILMVLSGGYSKRSAAIIGESIENILKNIIRLLPF